MTPERKAAPHGGDDHRRHGGRTLAEPVDRRVGEADLLQQQVDAAADRLEEQPPGQKGDERGHRPRKQDPGSEEVAES